MVKNLLQDVVPPPRRSIRNVSVPSYRKKVSTEKSFQQEKPIDSNNLDNNKEDVIFKQKKIRLSDVEMVSPLVQTKNKKWKMWLIVSFLILVLLFFVFDIFFVDAKISITPKQQNVTFNEIIKIGDLPDGIPYEIITLTKTEGKSVSATENETVEERSFGTIIIYNNHTSVSQRLVKNTRFETPEGLIYRIQDSVNVPGQTKKDGKTIPGSVEAIVYADKAGEKYNIDQTDFSIPGFKVDPNKYKAFYARSKTPISGGFIGVRKKVSNTTKESSIMELKDILIIKLSKEISDLVPDNFVMFKDAIFFEFEEVPQTNLTDSSVTINVDATARLAIFNKDLLENAIANKIVPAFNNEDVEFSGLNDLKVSIQNKDNVDIKNHGIFNLILEGRGVIWTAFPEDKIKDEIAGKPKNVLQTVLSQYSSIKEAQAVLSPFWKMSFPKNPSDINIIRVLNEG